MKTGKEAELGAGVKRALPGHLRFDADDAGASAARTHDPVVGSVDSWRFVKANMLQDRQRWLVNMRWVAILCVVAVVSLAGALGWVETTLPLFITALFMVAYNLLFWTYWKQDRERAATRGGENALFLPILCDLGALTVLLHWSGGIENPFALFFAFHMAIGATLLSTRLAFVLGAVGSLLWGGTVFFEHTGQLAHSHLYLGGGGEGSFATAGVSGLQLAGYITAFVLMLFGVVYFVRTVEEGRWAAEAKAFQRERLAMARDRMARIGVITAGVAHTVRNPIQGVINCVDLLRQGSDAQDESRAELIEMMNEGLQRVERVTRRLLTLTRERHLAKQSTDLNTLIQESLRFLSPKASDKRIQIEMRLGKIPRLAVDPDSISEVIMNLVDNSIDACEEGDDVLVETCLADPAGRVISITVCDSGPGIPKEELAQVFDPFFTTKAVGEGAGLGLAIVSEVISAHSGSVRVLSDCTWGACFRILLPIEPGDEMNPGEDLDGDKALGSCRR